MTSTQREQVRAALKEAKNELYELCNEWPVPSKFTWNIDRKIDAALALLDEPDEMQAAIEKIVERHAVQEERLFNEKRRLLNDNQQLTAKHDEAQAEVERLDAIEAEADHAKALNEELEVENANLREALSRCEQLVVEWHKMLYTNGQIYARELSAALTPEATND